MKRLLFTVAMFLFLSAIGCGGNTASSKVQPTQPTPSPTPSPTPTPTPAPTPTVPTGWGTAKRQYYTFSYPGSWQLADGTLEDRLTTTTTESQPLHQIMVSFLPGFVNHPDTFRQCAGVDDYLLNYIKTDWESLETSSDQSPYITVSYDRSPQPSLLGGESTTVTVAVQAHIGELPAYTEVWLDAIPRKDGLYLIYYLYPGVEGGTAQQFIQEFTNAFVFGSKPLASDAPCNYLGQ